MERKNGKRWKRRRKGMKKDGLARGEKAREEKAS
jgi:hypothetical protein